jgi:hypothetical protein
MPQGHTAPAPHRPATVSRTSFGLTAEFLPRLRCQRHVYVHGSPYLIVEHWPAVPQVAEAETYVTAYNARRRRQVGGRRRNDGQRRRPPPRCDCRASSRWSMLKERQRRELSRVLCRRRRGNDGKGTNRQAPRASRPAGPLYLVARAGGHHNKYAESRTRWGVVPPAGSASVRPATPLGPLTRRRRVDGRRRGCQRSRRRASCPW